MTINRQEEFAEMFDQSWRALHENFYDAKFHGADWNAVREKYRPLVKHVRHEGGPVRPHQPDAGRAERLAPGHLRRRRRRRSRRPPTWA